MSVDVDSEIFGFDCHDGGILQGGGPMAIWGIWHLVVRVCVSVGIVYGCQYVFLIWR